jgi:hypothetical protein
VGSTILYRIVIDNTGNVPLDFAEFTDPHCDPGTLIGGPGAEPLQPGESSVYTCDHLLVAKNLKKGLPYENTATIKATPPPGDGGTISETSNTVVVYLLGGGGTTEFSCTGVTFSYTGFPNAENNTITQEIRINQELVSVTTFMFNGPSGSDTVPIEVPAGKSIVDAHAIWKTNGSGGGFDHHAKVKCTAPEEKNGNS